MPKNTEIAKKFLDHLKLYSPNISENIRHLELNSFDNLLLKEPSLSVIIMCKDEQRCIARCLNAIKNNIGINDEVIVIDTGSTDDTLNILNNFSMINKYSIIETSWNNDFAEIRNFGISQATKDWIVFIDADETIEKGSFDNLKSHLSIIDTLNTTVVCCPAIVNSGGHVVQTVRRIIPNNDSVFYFGMVHEEPRHINKSDLSFLAFDDVILHHDGYMKSVSSAKQKQERNTSLLYTMIDKEPLNPKWYYLLCRDGKGVLEENFYRDSLLKVLTLCGQAPFYEEYKLRALSDLIAHYLSAGDIENAKYYLEDLKKLAPNMTDTLYWDIFIQLIIFEYAYHQFIQQIIDYKQTNEGLDYGSLNSNGFHLDYLLSQLFFNIRDYNSCFNILKKLEDAQYGEYQENYMELNDALQKYLLQIGEENEKKIFHKTT